jgi:hypothetical protein
MLGADTASIGTDMGLLAGLQRTRR